MFGESVVNLYESPECHSRKIICMRARDLSRESGPDERRERKPVNRARFWQIEEERTERGAVRGTRSRRVDAGEKGLSVLS